jgi:hypothetical protein
MLATFNGSLCDAQDTNQQSEAKARFLAIVPGFVQWPSPAFAGPNAVLRICVHGDFGFGTSLAAVARNSTVSGHRLEIRWARSEQDLAGCQVIFVSRSAAKRYERVLESAKDLNTLTIGEDDAFLRAGGMMNLQAEPGGVQFDVNLDAVNAAHLKLSSQMLVLARHITRRTELARN